MLVCSAVLLADEPTKVRPIAWWSDLGRRSSGGGPVGGQKIVLITDAKAFAKAWSDMQPNETGPKFKGADKLKFPGLAPEINFSDYFVLVVTKPLGLDFAQPFGHLLVDGSGNAKIRGIALHGDNMNSVWISTTIAIFPRDGIKSVESKKLPPIE
jgi:hypothetical protein